MLAFERKAQHPVKSFQLSGIRGPIAVLRVVVMNTKGGCGKTTVATNLASYCAGQGYRSALFDYDPHPKLTGEVAV